MPPPLATLVFVLGILGLFLLDRDRKAQTSIALWLPIAWLVLGGSRQVSVWLGASAFTQSADQYLEGSPMDRAILSGLITVGLIVLGARAQRTGEAMRRNVPLLVVLLYCAASTLWSAIAAAPYQAHNGAGARASHTLPGRGANVGWGIATKLVCVA